MTTNENDSESVRPDALQVLLVDDHALVTDLVAKFLVADGGFRVESVATLEAALDRVNLSGPFDVVLLDVVLPGLNSIQDVTKVVEANEPGAVVLFSGAVSNSYVQKAVQSGARGFIPKSLPLKALTSAIRLVGTGQVFVPSDMVYFGESERSSGVEPLTRTETAVLQFVSEGMANKEIAFRIGLTESSVKMHVRAICRKLHAKNRTHAVILGKAVGLV